jgi:Flp pilus assembly protein TadB
MKSRPVQGRSHRNGIASRLRDLDNKVAGPDHVPFEPSRQFGAVRTSILSKRSFMTRRLALALLAVILVAVGFALAGLTRAFGVVIIGGLLLVVAPVAALEERRIRRGIEARGQTGATGGPTRSHR